MFENTWMIVSFRRLSVQEVMALEAQNGTMIQCNDPNAASKLDKNVLVGIENNYQVNPSEQLNTLKQDVKPLNINAVNQMSTELIHQNYYGMDLGHSYPTSCHSNIVYGGEDPSKFYSNAVLNGAMRTSESLDKQETHIEEIKSGNKILSTIENEYLNPGNKKQFNQNGTMIAHRWGKKQDVKLFKTLRQI